MATVNIGRLRFVWKGTYSGATAYVVDDVVYYAGGSYVCIANTTGNAPSAAVNTAYWNVMSVGGTDIVSLVGLTTGDIIVWNGTAWERKGMGTANQVLKVNSGATGLEYGSIDLSGFMNAATGSGSAYGNAIPRISSVSLSKSGQTAVLSVGANCNCNCQCC
jgi:hypothetical protein